MLVLLSLFITLPGLFFPRLEHLDEDDTRSGCVFPPLDNSTLSPAPPLFLKIFLDKILHPELFFFGARYFPLCPTGSLPLSFRTFPPKI